MGIKITQDNFAGGEASPLIEGRTTVDRLKTMVKSMENFLPYPQGPAAFMPGSRFISEVKSSSTRSRLVAFRFSDIQAYILEFGENYIRFYMNQGQILSGGAAYEIASPYNGANVNDLKFSQSADVLYITHKAYKPRKLSRTAHTAWTLQEINFRPPATREQIVKPAATLTLAALTGANILFTAGAAVFQSGDVKRIITSGVGRASITSFVSTTQVRCEIIDDFTSLGPIASQSWSLLGTPSGKITVSAKGPEGAIINIQTEGADGETFTDLLTDPGWVLSPVHAANHVYYLANTSTDYQATEPDRVYSGGAGVIVIVGSTHHVMKKGSIGSLGRDQWAWGDADTLGYDTIYLRLDDESNPNDAVTTDYVQCSQVDFPDVFRSSDVGKYILTLGGFIKITSYTSSILVSGECIKELNLVDEKDHKTYETIDWILEEAAWSNALGWPSCTTFFKDRLYFAGSTTYPQTIWGSMVGDYENFTPGADDSDAVEWTVAEREVNIIRWMQAKEDDLIVGTIGSIWKMYGDQDGMIAPLTINAVELPAYYGCADIQPVKAGGAIIFAQEFGLNIREISYKWETNGYDAEDLTALAEHITEGGVTAMAFTETPFPVLWCIRADGVLLGLTYVKTATDYVAIGWFRVVTDGRIESITTIPGTTQDETWILVRRVIEGSVKRYVELFEPFWMRQDAKTDAKFCHSGLAYSGAAVTTLTGLDHLNGETVAVIGNGSYLGTKVVAGGQITDLPVAVTTAYVGLPYTGTLELLKPEMDLRDGSSVGRTKRIQRLHLNVEKSVGAKVGKDTSNLISVPFGPNAALYTGTKSITFDGKASQEPTCVIVQDLPMPLVIRSVTAEIEI